MAKISQFIPPPNWPPPPAGCTAPPAWQPDPAWGPPPPGWPLWIQVRANPNGWVYAQVSAAALYVALLLIVAIAIGGVPRAETAGKFRFAYLVAGITAAFISRSARSRWRIWVYPLVVLGVVLIVRALTVIGQQTPGA